MNDQNKNLNFSRRDFFAAFALAGVEASNILQGQGEFLTIEQVAERAILLADELIEQIDNPDILLNNEPEGIIED